MANSKRKCALRTCKVYFRPADGIVKGVNAWCCFDHQIEWSMIAGNKLRKASDKALAQHKRGETKELRAKLKTRSEWLKEAQQAFNKWIRTRDRHLPCVSCRKHITLKVNAGHYRSVGSMPSLRFEPLNCWLQCEPCNTNLSGNLIEYRKELLERIGAEKLAWLEGPHEPKHYTIEEIKAIKAHYKAAVKLL